MNHFLLYQYGPNSKICANEKLKMTLVKANLFL